MTLLIWLLTVVVVPLLLAEFTDVAPWLAEKVVRRAALCIPEPERARWHEEWTAELQGKPGRLWKLLWALSLLPGAGRMGRMLGAPSAFETLRARMRAVWQRLRLRPKATGSEPVVAQAEPQPATPTVNAQAVTKVLADAGSATDALVVRGGRLVKPAASQRELKRRMRRNQFEFETEVWLATQAWLAEVAQEQRQFEERLAQQRREFEDSLDRMKTPWTE